METDLLKMSDKEKEAHIGYVEIMLDYGDGDKLSNDDIELYNQLVSKQSQAMENTKAALDDVISSAEKRRNEQNEINTEQIDREALKI